MKQVETDIVKINDEERLVFGWANVAVRKDGEQIVDSQNHLIDPTDLEFAAYLYVLKFREGDEMHTQEVKAHLVESFMVTSEKLEKMGLAPDALPQGWWVGFYVDDEALWEKVKKGQYRMFSIAGTATMQE